MKKKLLEIQMDENGKITFSSDYNPLSEGDVFTESYCHKFSAILDEMVEKLFLQYKDGSQIGQIVKLLTMADIAADAQPYECAEQLWYTMMFSYLPQKEKMYRKMKQKHGVKIAVHEPVIGTSVIGGNKIKS